ncbi:MAG: DNA polymerase sliding clamp [Candidatus Nitrosocaldaceae archaeon]|nr:MAG: DNA polymerase sliding clamp [Candidatus Nitrosocaldaceae archaeon]
MLIARTVGPEGWKAVASAISTLLEEATFEATSESISFRGMDPSHVALIDINWPNSAFEAYECDSEVRFGVRIDELTKLLKRADKNDNIEVSIGDDNMFTLKIFNSYKKMYKIHLIDATASTTPVPKLSFNSKIGLSIQAFKDILDDVEVVADYVTIEASNDKVTFYGKGDLGEASITLEKEDSKLESLEVKENSKATYSLEYLSSITKAIGSSAEGLIIEFSSAMPIRLEFDVSKIGKIHFYLAPRVES